MNRLHLLENDHSRLPADFWSARTGEVLVAARWAEGRSEEVAWLHQRLPYLPGHVWFATSGTLARAGESKWVSLSKEALLASAAAVNHHLEARATDVWGLTLPLAHVGGLGVVARAHLLGQKVLCLTPGRWEPARLHADRWDGHFLSLVPAQLHDLVSTRVTPPKGLRAVILGGDRLDDELARRALAEGWPVRASYGLTEFASQVATATEEHPLRPQPLTHVRLQVDEEDRLWIEGPSLFTGMARVAGAELVYEARAAGPWRTGDRARVTETGLEILGRADGMVKVRGEKVDIPTLERQLSARLGQAILVLALPDVRDGHALWWVSEAGLSAELVAQVRQELLPHQRPRGTRVKVFPRTELGKIKRMELQDELARTSD